MLFNIVCVSLFALATSSWVFLFSRDCRRIEKQLIPALPRANKAAITAAINVAVGCVRGNHSAGAGALLAVCAGAASANSSTAANATTITFAIGQATEGQRHGGACLPAPPDALSPVIGSRPSSE